MKTITSYRHPATDAPQEPDTALGNYYVSIIHETKGTCLALGPFPNDHAAALACVDEVRSYCCEREGRMHFDCKWGTVRMADTFTTPGKLNHHLPHIIPQLTA
jgi:hypothetical protein